MMTRSLAFMMALLLLPVAQVMGQNQAKSGDSVWRTDSLRRQMVLGRLGGELQRIGIAKWYVPEYHDEQRFPVWPGSPANRTTIASSGTYGPVVNIFASPFLDDFTAPWQFYEHGTRGVLVAVLFVDTGTLPQIYQAVGLRSGVNCLWLSHTAPGSWQGSISPASAAGLCDRTLPSSQYTPLRVNRAPPVQGATFADYPPVARFSESAEGIPLFGVKCLDGWCEFGPNGAWTALQIPIPTSMPVRRIKGWYDEQWLAQYDATGVLRPLVYAAVFPARDIASHSVNDYASPVAVATVMLAVNPPQTSKYYKWGLRQGENTLYLRRTGSTWAMRVGSLPGAKWLTTHRMPHMDVAVPGTARWRYISQDDGMWVPCGMACCRVVEGDG